MAGGSPTKNRITRLSVPVYRFTVNEKEDLVCRQAAGATPYTFNDWLRQAVVSAGLAHAAAPPTPRSTKEDARTLARFTETLVNIRDNPTLRGDVAAFVELRREEYRRGFATKAANDYTDRFAEWAAANGHMKGEA